MIQKEKNVLQILHVDITHLTVELNKGRSTDMDTADNMSSTCFTQVQRMKHNLLHLVSLFDGFKYKRIFKQNFKCLSKYLCQCLFPVLSKKREKNIMPTSRHQPLPKSIFF